jgi:hypothetical protein
MSCHVTQTVRRVCKSGGIYAMRRGTVLTSRFQPHIRPPVVTYSKRSLIFTLFDDAGICVQHRPNDRPQYKGQDVNGYRGDRVFPATETI